jgi:hypothetical protein
VIPGTLQVRAIKVTIVVRPEDALAIAPAAGAAPVAIVVRTEAGRMLRATLNSKTLRKVQTAIRQAGLDQVAVVLQGKLETGDRIAEAGLIAQLRQPKAQAGPAPVPSSAQEPFDAR